MLVIAVTVLAAAIFIFDTATQEPLAIAVLYVVVVFTAANSGQKRLVVRASIACVALTLLSFFLVHSRDLAAGPAARCLISVSAIIVAAFLALRNLNATALLLQQAQLLDQTHDSVIVTDLLGRVTYWNKGATTLYGWPAREAAGAVAHELLRTRFPVSDSVLEVDLAERGFWEGELLHASKDGRSIATESRLSLLRDDRGQRVAIIATANDITRRKRADQGLARSETRYRSLFQTTSLSILECDVSALRLRILQLGRGRPDGFKAYLRTHPEFVHEAVNLTRVRDVNDAAVRTLAAKGKDELIGSLAQILPVESVDVFAQAMTAAVEKQSNFEAEVSP
ncbi:PAS domain-containing protein, partial [Bosea sp. TAB14]|uniref:PAS domain-containing protein n=1 Tax=Bosea sp. TAB14 TaxID=3237481 RepID=UPI003F902976